VREAKQEEVASSSTSTGKNTAQLMQGKISERKEGERASGDSQIALSQKLESEYYILRAWETQTFVKRKHLGGKKVETKVVRKETAYQTNPGHHLDFRIANGGGKGSKKKEKKSKRFQKYFNAV